MACAPSMPRLTQRPGRSPPNAQLFATAIRPSIKSSRGLPGFHLSSLAAADNEMTPQGKSANLRRVDLPRRPFVPAIFQEISALEEHHRDACDRVATGFRSEERRVGKEVRSRWSPSHSKKYDD